MPRRFDTDLMLPPTPGPAPDAALLARVRRWCETGAVPRMTQPIAIAAISSPAGIDAVACELDGSCALARLGRWRGLAWRLQVLINDHRADREALPGDPWDCGWWRDGALDAAAAFLPRRATLLLVRETDRATVDALLARLTARSPAYVKPLRVLVASTTAREGFSLGA